MTVFMLSFVVGICRYRNRDKFRNCRLAISTILRDSLTLFSIKIFIETIYARKISLGIAF